MYFIVGNKSKEFIEYMYKEKQKIVDYITKH